jgi:hypothetical protein
MNIKINDGRQNLTEELGLNCKLISNDERNYLREKLLENKGDKYIYLKINSFKKIIAEIDGESVYTQTKNGQDSIYLNHSSLGLGIKIKFKDLIINREDKIVLANNLYFCSLEYYTGDMKDVYTSYIEPRFK